MKASINFFEEHQGPSRNPRSRGSQFKTSSIESFYGNKYSSPTTYNPLTNFDNQDIGEITDVLEHEEPTGLDQDPQLALTGPEEHMTLEERLYTRGFEFGQSLIPIIYKSIPDKLNKLWTKVRQQIKKGFMKNERDTVSTLFMKGFGNAIGAVGFDFVDFTRINKRPLTVPKGTPVFEAGYIDMSIILSSEEAEQKDDPIITINKLMHMLGFLELDRFGDKEIAYISGLVECAMDKRYPETAQRLLEWSHPRTG